jgi:squalene synthase HpnC
MGVAPANPIELPLLPGVREVLDRAEGENFPVALRFLPRDLRGHLNAIYGFARLVDDIGDEISGDRLAALDEIDREIERIYRGEPADHPLMRRLATSVKACGLPRQPLHNLVEANRRDQSLHRYSTYEELLAYASLSANPVGRLVLAVFRDDRPENLRRSDAVCTALQIVEHCQDVGEDYRRGRIYLPAEDLAHFGCEPSALGATRATPALRRVIAFQITRVRALLRSGDYLVAALRGSARFAVAGFCAGGYAAADAVEAQGFEVLRRTPKPRRLTILRHALRLLIGRPR